MIETYHLVLYNLKIQISHKESGSLMFTREQEIEEFLQEYKRSRVITESTVKASLNRAVEFEQKFQKPFYGFNTKEILEMYTSTHAISERSLENTNLTLKNASRWIISKKGLNSISSYELITRELMRDCVDIEKKQRMFFTKDDLDEIKGGLLNWMDKAILLLLFEGAGGFYFKELTFMDWDQVNKRDLKIYFRTGKVIDISLDDYKLLYRAFRENELISFGATSMILKVKNLGLYKPRVNSLSDNDNATNEGDIMRRYRFIQRRIDLISNYFGIELNGGAIQTSGLLHHLKQDVEKSKMTFLEYVKTKEARQLARRYDIYSEFAPQILSEKFQEYFK